MPFKSDADGQASTSPRTEVSAIPVLIPICWLLRATFNQYSVVCWRPDVLDGCSRTSSKSLQSTSGRFASDPLNNGIYPKRSRLSQETAWRHSRLRACLFEGQGGPSISLGSDPSLHVLVSEIVLRGGRVRLAVGTKSCSTTTSNSPMLKRLRGHLVFGPGFGTQLAVPLC